MGVRYHYAKDGEWIRPKMTGYRLRCCDCGLIHVLNFQVEHGREVIFQAARDERATALTRERRRGVQTSGTCPPMSDNTQRRPKPKKGTR